MTINALQKYRAFRDDGIEFGRGRETAELPDHLIPAATLQPATAWVRGGEGFHDLLRLRQRLGAGQVRGLFHEA